MQKHLGLHPDKVVKDDKRNTNNINIVEDEVNSEYFIPKPVQCIIGRIEDFDKPDMTDKYVEDR